MRTAWNNLLCSIFGHRYAKVNNPPYVDAGPDCEFAGCVRCRELFVLNHDARVVLEFWRVAHLYRQREEWRKRDQKPPPPTTDRSETP